MDSNKLNELKKLSGTQNQGDKPSLILNEIRFNGRDGHFILIDKVSGKVVDEFGEENYQKTDLGTSVELTFLRVRRQMSCYVPDFKTFSTSEHNSKQDKFIVYGLPQAKRLNSDQAREEVMAFATKSGKSASLKTVQVVYALYNGELVRFFVKGSALGSEARDKDVKNFYQYVNSLAKDGIFSVTTELSAFKEKGKAGIPYFTYSFNAKSSTPVEALDLVEIKLTELFTYCNELDKYNMTNSAAQEGSELVINEDNFTFGGQNTTAPRRADDASYNLDTAWNQIGSPLDEIPF